MSAQQNQTQSLKWNNSIFIPMIDFNITKNQIKEIMEEHFGKISRIDFVSFNSNNGCGRRAFIHFAQWDSNNYSDFVRYSIETNGFYDMLIPPMNGNLKYNVRLLVNKNPVPETDQTIQQVASNMDFMAEKIRVQEEEIKGLKQTCDNLVFYMNQLQLRMNEMLYQKSIVPIVPSIIEDDTMGEMQVSELL